MTLAELRQYQTQEALNFLTAFCEQPSNDPAARLQQGAAYVHAGRVYQVRGEREKAHEAFHQAIAVFGRLVQDFPDDPTYPRELAEALHILAEDLYRAGRLREANAYFSQALRVYREALQNHPTDVEILWKLVMALCGWFDPELRNPRGALELARRAVEVAPQLPRPWLALGVASYRAREWGAAVDALQEAHRHWKEGDWTRAQITCHLTMAQWRCGKRAEALESYQETVRLMEKNFDARDSALRAEAASLLGIQEPPMPQGKEAKPRKE